MPNFFIADENVLSKQKITKIISRKGRYEVILRDRTKDLTTFKADNFSKNSFLSTNYKPFLKTYAKGTHASIYYDKLISKIPKYGTKTVGSHDIREILIAKRIFRADFIFISPVFPTLTHKNEKSLGIIKLFTILNQPQSNNINFILLGGMNEKRYKILKFLDFRCRIKGFAGIRSFMLTEKGN